MKSSTNIPSLKNLIVQLWHHLNRRRQQQFGLLLSLMLISAFSEVISLGAVLPFLGILIAPEHVFNIPIVMDVAHYFGITSAEQLVLPLTLVFAVTALMTGVSLMLKMIFKGNALSLRSKLSLLFWFELAPRPYGRILNPTTRPYYWARYCTC